MKMLEIGDKLALEEAVRLLTCRAADGGVGSASAEKAQAVAAIVEAVRERGDEAVAEYAQQFDGVALAPGDFELSAEELETAASQVERPLLAALERACENIRRFHANNLRESWEETAEDGTVLGQRITPIERVGVYVPGGKAFYPSSVLMNIVPARVAGVSEIVMVSPPSYEGAINPVVLAAARIAGATRVFRVGGAQAIAALAYGTETIPPVLKITGPGNTYVTIAKRLVQSVCAIDTEAGPSEVVVIADAKADPRYVAAEMLAQAEHDEEAAAILLTSSGDLARAVLAEIDAQSADLAREGIIRKALEAQGAVVVTRSLDEAARITDELAPEHLVICTEYPRKVFDKVSNAGAAFLGSMSPVAIGDYYAGPNHILPTARRARFASPLTTEDFRKVTSVISYSKERLMKDADDIIRLATAEQLTAHANTVEIRK